MLKKFDDTVTKVLEKHGVEDEKLAAVLHDLFLEFDHYVRSSAFVDEITRQQQRENFRIRRRP